MVEFPLMQNMIPDIFYVGAHTWGIEILCLCLLPLSLSIVVLIIATIKIIHVAVVEGRQQMLLFSLSTLFILLALCAGLRLFAEGIFVSSGLYVLSLAVTFTVLLPLWVLLLVIYRPLSFTIIVYAGLGALFGFVGIFALWLELHSSIKTAGLMFVGEALIFISVGFISVFVEYIRSRLVPFTS